MTSPGKIQEYLSNTPGTTSAKLYDFDVGKARVKAEHESWLNSVVVPLLRRGGSVTIIGLASRTGSDDFNMELSEKRNAAVLAVLRKQVPTFNVSQQVAKGESAAKFAGEKDGTERNTWRAVIISVWNRPDPPPPPPPPPPLPAQSPHAISKFNRRWIGFGAKAGGQLLFGGVESLTGYVMNLGDGETFDLKIVSSRYGFGLGGSAGFVVIFGFGFSVPYEMQNEPVDDWGVNIAFTEKFVPSSVLTSIKNSRWFVDGLKGGLYQAPKLIISAVRDDVELLQNLRNLLHTMYGGLETAKGHRGLVVIDLPVLGWGLEASVVKLHGSMIITNPSHWIGPDD